MISRAGYIITYANCSIIWCRKLQTEIVLSTTKSECIALSQSLRDVLPLMELLKEIRNTIPSEDRPPIVYCTIFEVNMGYIDLVKTPRMKPRTKHIALKYHHFRSLVKSGSVLIKYVETHDQITEIFTKALYDAQFCNLRKGLSGW